MSEAPQTILRIRRDYNSWVANETLEDYALRYTPRSVRRWSEFSVANTAFGATSFLALEAIGGAMAVAYGFSNALWAIAVVGLIIFLTALPITYYAARYGLDMDLLTRGAGFGYIGSTLTSLIYASFTFIFFALEAAILAQVLEIALGWPAWLAYLVASLGIVPLVLKGITLISRLQAWTQPLWLVLLVLPYAWLAFHAPERFASFSGMAGSVSGSAGFDGLMFGAACSVAFSLVVQVGEQVDFLRFLPERTAANRWRWWAAVLVGGPGWIVPGALKMAGGAFLAHLLLQAGQTPDQALEPTRMYLHAFGLVFDTPSLALAAAVLFVIVSQGKINVTNAYAGSLAWSNFFARLTHSHPGRVVWLVFNVLIAVLLIGLGIFEALEGVLALYGNLAIAWVGALVADLCINKPLGLSPARIEFRRAHLYDLNPVGLGSMASAATLSIVSFTGLLGPVAEAYSAFIALGTALLVSPLLAWATQGRYYLARKERPRWQPGEMVTCSVCENEFESEDMAWCPAYAAPICSLCCTLESRCHDRCKTDSRAVDQVRRALVQVLPRQVAQQISFRVGLYLVVVVSLLVLLAVVLGAIYAQQTATHPGMADFIAGPMLRTFALLSLVAAVGAWWIVLGSESREMAEEESNRQNQLLRREIEAHSRTDEELKTAKEQAEAASQAKTRYIAGITHELRTPLNSILGYAQILQREASITGAAQRAVQTIHRSGEHLHSLVDGLLDLARIEAGRLRLDNGTVDMRGLLEEIEGMVRPQAQAKGLVFEMRLNGLVPHYVKTDAKRLRQILLNLLGNAVRFTEQGTVRLLVDWSREVARFEVSDTGIGIAPQDLERIFLPFERGSAGRRSNEMGTGLGLTITLLLTHLMGGELTLESQLNRGSTFNVRLYLGEVRSPGSTPVQRSRPVTGYIGRRRELLIVDDQATQRHLLAGLLLPLGFDIREAASGPECLENLAARAPDAILMDISMSPMDGWETVRRVRACGLNELPIIMVSANAFENRVDYLESAGANAFLDKPVMESELHGTLQRLLELEWVTDLPKPGWTTGTGSAGPESKLLGVSLPLDYASSLWRQARLGHVLGLHQTMDDLVREHPELEPAADLLREYTVKFDFQGLQARLKKLAPDLDAEDTT